MSPEKLIITYATIYSAINQKVKILDKSFWIKEGIILEELENDFFLVKVGKGKYKIHKSKLEFYNFNKTLSD